MTKHRLIKTKTWLFLLVFTFFLGYFTGKGYTFETLNFI